MEQLEIYLLLLGITVVIGQFFYKSSIPTALLLVIAGMLLCLLPHFPVVHFNPAVVLNIFLPLLVYQISAYASWKDLRKNIRPVSLLSIGHVVFIAVLVAIVVHKILPQLGWPLAFVLGAVVAPPDSVAIVAIAEKVHMPAKLITILEGESMLNDATALILFRFALIAVATHQFSLVHAVSNFVLVVVGETLYGLVLGYVIGELRSRVHNSMLHIIVSLMTPFLAYLPAEKLGGCGVLATVVTGFVIGHIYYIRITPEFRLISRAVWPALTFAIQGILFLMVGLNLHDIIKSMSTIPLSSLLLYGVIVVLTVILGRFIWVYGAITYLPRLYFWHNKKSTQPNWRFPIVISWAGIRGGISLAAAFAVPFLPTTVEGANARDLLLFLVFCVIIATLLLQGLTLPWLLKWIGLPKCSAHEKHTEYHAELMARIQMTKKALRWLVTYKNEIKDEPQLLEELKLHIYRHRMLKIQLKERLQKHDNDVTYDDTAELIKETTLLSELVKIERKELLRLWHAEKINLSVRNRLLERLDHRAKHLSSLKK